MTEAMTCLPAPETAAAVAVLALVTAYAASEVLRLLAARVLALRASAAAVAVVAALASVATAVAVVDAVVSDPACGPENSAAPAFHTASP